MKSSEIRNKFFNFFVKHGHTQVASSSIIPAQDPTLLFANAGMNQFKDVFLGKEKRSYTRAVSIQKCVRAGGKHNDLDNVGFTKRHLTFFEMMGNFSFGDYFKKEAIEFAWDFITKEMKLPTGNLWVSVYTTDDEAYNIWQNQIGVPAERIVRLGEAENFWSMGDVGPCGPCTEIHVDRGPEFGCKDIKDCGPACNCDRFLEIWNLVFMQFDRSSDGSMKELAHKGVDTGMGLERLCVVVQNKDSVYQTDVFASIIGKIEELTGLSYAAQDPLKQAAFHVLADHIRSSTLIIADGGAPSNEGRGYVLRKIIRRAALFAQKLTDKNIFPELSAVVVADLGEYYPSLAQNQKLIYKVLQSEIEKFATNLVRGTAILDRYIQEGPSIDSGRTDKENNSDKTLNKKNAQLADGEHTPFAPSRLRGKVISGEQAFRLYDTYGFPIELVILMAGEKGFTVDTDGFEKEMDKQKGQSGKKVEDPLDHLELPEEIQSEFTGYQELETTSEINALIADHQLVQTVPAGTDCWVITRKSPYFIVGGGQVPDTGWLMINGTKAPLKIVRFINGRIAALITAPSALKVGQTVTEVVDKTWRTNAMKNHTATHMLQSALIQVLGPTIKQSGSLVHPDYLRFDFTYPENLAPELITQVENIVNQKIMEDIQLTIKQTTLKDALDHGALAFFGDKYNPEQVRMVKINDFSTELCGGTHVPATGVIGAFKITEVTALSAGYRRIFAVTGPRALELFQECYNTVKSLGQEFKVKREEVLDNVLKQRDQLKQAQNEVRQLKKEFWRAQVPGWLAQVEMVGSIPALVLSLKDFGADDLKELANALQQKQPGFYFMISATDDKSNFVMTVDPKFASTLNLKDFGTWLKDEHGLRGGVSQNSIQGGGGKFGANLQEAIFGWLRQQS